jgi:methylated-DNA-[protein]-cysteine S-methyltransferase
MTDQYTLLSYKSPLGLIILQATRDALVRVDFADKTYTERNITTKPTRILRYALQELTDYFIGTRHEFTVPLAPNITGGTPFQQQVWDALEAIPYGKMVTYADIAQAIGAPKAVRAVGQAIHRNPLGIIIPCHRVIGKNGTLTGYAAGLSRKQWLLTHEQQHMP